MNTMSDEEREIYDRNLKSYRALAATCSLEDFIQYAAFSSALHIVEQRRLREHLSEIYKETRKNSRVK